MKSIVYLAWRYLAYHRLKTAILISSITLILYLPVGLRVLVNQSSQQLTARAASTPLVVGAKGSPLELVLNALYFESDPPAPTDYAQVTRIADSDLAAAIEELARNGKLEAVPGSRHAHTRVLSQQRPERCIARQDGADLPDWRIEIEQFAAALHDGEDIRRVDAVHCEQYAAAILPEFDDARLPVDPYGSPVTIAGNGFDARSRSSGKETEQSRPIERHAAGQPDGQSRPGTRSIGHLAGTAQLTW